MAAFCVEVAAFSEMATFCHEVAAIGEIAAFVEVAAFCVEVAALVKFLHSLNWPLFAVKLLLSGKCLLFALK